MLIIDFHIIISSAVQ